MSHLRERSILEISGSSRKSFLQGLVSNDVNKASPTNLIYAVMLNATGRFLYDFFIFENGEKLIVDCFAPRRDEILKKLNFYKLRADVVIKKNDELLVAVCHPRESGDDKQLFKFIDPRSEKLGYRIYGTASELAAIESDLMSEDSYHFNRIQNKIPESENDLTYEKSLILEFGFDNLNAISYEKGCYIGQELTARTHYKGEIRKKLFHIKITARHPEPVEGLLKNDSTALRLLSMSKDQSDRAEKGLEISCEGKSVGIILSSIHHQNELHALALVRLPDNLEDKNFTEKLEFENRKISIIS